MPVRVCNLQFAFCTEYSEKFRYGSLNIYKALCKIVGKSEELEKLTGSLLVDSSKIRSLLGCLPAGREAAIHHGRGD